MTLRFVVPGEPTPKGRPRFNRATGNVYTPKTTVAAEQEVAVLCKQAAIAGGVELPFAGPLEVLVVAASRKRDAVDLDNVVKLVLDGLNAVAWGDDKQVKAIGATLEDQAATARTLVVIRPARRHDGG